MTAPQLHDPQATEQESSQDESEFAPVLELDISHLVIENDIPVDNFQSEKQQRLLVEPLYSSWPVDRSFIAAANVGLFYLLKGDPIVPDAFLSLDVRMPEDWSQKRNRSYFVWEFGKVPDVCIEIVSNREGGELDSKKHLYARIGVPYYAVFDPLEQLQRADELNGVLLKVWTLMGGTYAELSEPLRMPGTELGLTVWEGSFEEDVSRLWLRWCDLDGQVIPTGKERAEQEKQRAEQEKQRADRLADRLRALGIDPEQI